MSLRTVTTSVVDGMHNVWTMHVPRAQRRWQAHCRARSRRMCQRRAGRRSASGQCLKHHIQLLTCKRVLPRESMCTAGEARTHGACVTSVLCTRVLVCKAQSSERGRGSGEAIPVRDMLLRAPFVCSGAKPFCSVAKNAKRAFVGGAASKTGTRRQIVRRAEGSLARPRDAGGDAAHCCAGHGAQAIHGSSKRKDEDQNDGSAGSWRRA